MVVKRGKVLLEFGDLEARGFMAEGRCSVLAMLFGKAVSEGSIDLRLTLEELGIDDRPGLLPMERRATIEDLLTNRSAVYHPTEFIDPTEGLPARGSVEPGTHFYFHSWACLAARVIYEMLTERDFFQAVEEDLAVPLGLLDYTRRSHNAGQDRSRSLFTLFHLYFSTRDVARIGQLMLQNGDWEGQQLIPRGWVARMTTMVTPPAEVNPASYRQMGLGFGYQWWVWPESDPINPYAGAYTYRADWGQFLTVLPRLEMVVAHQRFAGWYGRPDRSVTAREYLELLNRIVAAAGDPGTRTAGGP
jgi:CubicO group peptidase (beta-lactamase class C family)